jgi:hypothetical protein
MNVKRTLITDKGGIYTSIMKKCVIILMLFTSHFAFADGYELPLFNPDLLTFFSSESRYSLAIMMENPGDLYQYGSGGWFDDTDEQKVLEVDTGFIFPVGKYISIPIFFAVLSNSPTMSYFPIFWPIDPTYYEMFTGSGLIFKTKWITLGTYFGYYTLNDVPGLNYSVVPIINTNLGYLKKIESYFSTGKFNFQKDSEDKTSFDLTDITFYTKLVFKGWSLFNQNRNLFEPYYSRGNYDWKTKNSIYGLRLGINHLTLEGGYRDFDEGIYSNTIFVSGNFSFSSPDFIQGMFSNEECFISFAVDLHNKKFGMGISDAFSQNGGNGIIMLEFCLSEDNSFSVSFTEKIYINWSKF